MFLYNVYIVHVLVRIKFLTPTPFILFSKSRGFLKTTYIKTGTPERNRRETRKFFSLSVIEQNIDLRNVYFFLRPLFGHTSTKTLS